MTLTGAADHTLLKFGFLAPLANHQPKTDVGLAIFIDDESETADDARWLWRYELDDPTLSVPSGPHTYRFVARSKERRLHPSSSIRYRASERPTTAAG
jgi:hypothetical protein